MTPIPFYAVPGLLNDARVWSPQTGVLGHRRTVRVADVTRHDSIATMAAAALADAPASRFALAGFSLGGYVALEMIRQAPERVAALALVDTGARADSPESTAMRQRVVVAAGAGATGFDAAARAFLPRLIPAERADDTALVELFLDMARAVGFDAFVRQQTAAMSRIDSRPTLPGLRCPTLVVCGRQDRITPLDLAEEMAAAIPAARLVVVEDCGHMAPLERPEVVTAALVDWLDAADSS